jgi:hypothetical protein
MFFPSAFEPRVEAGIQDRAFCVRTRYGAKTFEFLSWMTDEPIAVHSVMPATVLGSKGQLISALRRWRDARFGDVVTQNCWIDVYRFLDDGRTWEFLSKAADTGSWNGNPPTL